jgi:hypothetical protein
MAIMEYAAVTSPLDLLKRSLDANVVWPFRLVMAELDNTPEWQPCQFGQNLPADAWWDAITNFVRATRLYLYMYICICSRGSPHDPGMSNMGINGWTIGASLMHEWGVAWSLSKTGMHAHRRCMH